MTREQHLARMAAVCVIVGSVCVLGFRQAHGDLPTDTGQEALSFVAARPLYPLVHFGDFMGVLVWTGGLVALSFTCEDRAAWALGRLGAASVLGAAVHITEFSVDGYALPTLANAWRLHGPGTDDATQLGRPVMGRGGASLSAPWPSEATLARSRRVQ